MGNGLGLGAVLNRAMEEAKDHEKLMLKQSMLAEPVDLGLNPQAQTALNVDVPVGKVNVGATILPKYKQVLNVNAGMPIGKKTYVSGSYSPKGSFDGGKMFGFNIERKF